MEPLLTHLVVAVVPCLAILYYNPIIRLGNDCTFGWYYFKNKCYFVKENEFYKYGDAENLCNGMDGRLVIIKDADVGLFLSEFGSRTNLWIGMSDKNEEGKWRWIDGSTVSTSNIQTWLSGYSNWRNGRPSNSPGQDNCGYLNKGMFNGEWNDASCSQKMGFICEKDLFK